LRKYLDRRAAEGAARRVRHSYRELERGVLQLVRAPEAEQLARKTGFYRRAPRAIEAFPFALCCALGALVEGKRGFASVWRLLAVAAGTEVARSAVTQRFDDESAAFMEALFMLAVSRLPRAAFPEMLSMLDQFRRVLADDATVLQLSPLLGKLFPATRTKTMGAAGKLHVRADLVHRRVVGVVVTGERQSDVSVARSLTVQRGTLYIRDLGYVDYDELARIVEQGGQILMRLKEGAAPTIVKVRHGLRNGAELVRRGVRWNDVTQIDAATTRTTIDFDAAFPTKHHGQLVLRVVGILHPETQTYHFYVTSLDAAGFSPEEIRTLYARRWQIELLMKLLRSSCHLDHLDTSNPGALRTHIYASLLASVILSGVIIAAAAARGLPASAISPLMVGIAAPLIALPLSWLWLRRRLTKEEMADCLLRMIAVGCRDQNPNRTEDKWGVLSRD
jgi:IS4 transposase